MTLIGDAAHLRTPFAGSGANLSMLDGLELEIVCAEAMNDVKTSEERETAIALWEKTFVLAEMTRVSQENLHQFLEPGTINKAKEVVAEHIHEESRNSN